MLPKCTSCIVKKEECTHQRQVSKPGLKRGYIKSLENKLHNLQNQLCVSPQLPENFIRIRKDVLERFFVYMYDYASYLIHKPTFFDQLEDQDPLLLCLMYAITLRYDVLVEMEEADFSEPNLYFEYVKANFDPTKSHSIETIAMCLFMSFYLARKSHCTIFY